MSRTNIAIVGCGEVAQIIHLPALAHLADKFAVTALCDISERVLEGVSAKCPGARTYVDYNDMLRDETVDAVLIANPHAYHAEVATASMQHGKDVFIEKPACMNLQEADALAEVEARTGRIAQVGYMRRYAGAFLEAVELVRREEGKIRLARVQDVIGKNALIIDDTSRIVRDPDLPESQKTALKALEEQKIQDAIGDAGVELRNSYSLLLGLSSHDLSAMRELLGSPRGVLHASHRWEGRQITAVFDYGSYVCEFATGVDLLPRFDTFLEVYSEERVIRIDYDTPYVRNLPARLSVLETHGVGGVAQTVSYPSRLDSFVVEWESFYDSVKGRSAPKTTIADAREDLTLFLDIIERIRSEAA